MKLPEDRRYTDDHEWALAVSETVVRIGITEYAQDALGDIVYVELPSVGAAFEAGGTLAEVESTKSVADVYAPLAGTVTAINETLTELPELVNSDPYGEGWFIELELSDPESLSELLEGPAYAALIEE